MFSSVWDAYIINQVMDEVAWFDQIKVPVITEPGSSQLPYLHQKVSQNLMGTPGDENLFKTSSATIWSVLVSTKP